jgi:hypothetical protein
MGFDWLSWFWSRMKLLVRCGSPKEALFEYEPMAVLPFILAGYEILLEICCLSIACE